MKRLILSLLFCASLTTSKAQLFLTPNPFIGQVTLSYTVAATDTVTFKVYNTLGNLMKTFINDSLMIAGTYSINYTPVGWTNGIFFFSLFVGDSTYVKKAIYMGGSSVGINQIKQNAQSLNIYPNPVNNILNIETIDTDGEIKITDIFGNEIKKTNFTNNNNKNILICVNDLKEGVYIVQLITKENSSMRKIIIQH